MKLIKYIGAVVLLLSMTTSCSEDKYGEHSEIAYPIPVISSVTADVGVGEVRRAKFCYDRWYFYGNCFTGG